MWIFSFFHSDCRESFVCMFQLEIRSDGQNFVVSKIRLTSRFNTRSIHSFFGQTVSLTASISVTLTDNN